jgi:hypothetical protein
MLSYQSGKWRQKKEIYMAFWLALRSGSIKKGSRVMGWGFQSLSIPCLASLYIALFDVIV